MTQGYYLIALASLSIPELPLLGSAVAEDCSPEYHIGSRTCVS